MLLRDADQTCSPNLPPHINAHSLTAHDLRNAVVPSARFYARCQAGVVPYERRVSASLSKLVWEPESSSSSSGSRMVKLLPGGQYLFIANSKIAHILDLQRPEVPIWSRTAQSLSLNRDHRGCYWISHIACELCEDGSITALLVAKDADSHDV